MAPPKRVPGNKTTRAMDAKALAMAAVKATQISEGAVATEEKQKEKAEANKIEWDMKEAKTRNDERKAANERKWQEAEEANKKKAAVKSTGDK